MSHIHGPHPSPEAQALHHQRTQAHKTMTHRHMMQVTTHHYLTAHVQKGVFNPVAMKKAFRTLNTHRTREQERRGRIDKKEIEGYKIENVKEVDEAASRFSRKNPELDAKILLILRSRILAGDTKDEILRKVLEFYPDLSLADEALDYLLETTKGDLHETVLKAKEELQAKYEREIKAGRNIALEARQFSEEGLGSPTALRDMYRDITGNQREVHKLFDELTRQFDYDKMNSVIKFLLHSLGSDLKSKGPSISRGELYRLIEDTRTLQAILGVFYFFKGRMKLIHSQFSQYDLAYPSRITFEILAKRFMQLISERYVSSERVLQLSRTLGISQELLAQLIIYAQMRDAIRHVSPRLYRSNQHKEEALGAFIKVLEDLEDELEEEGENEEEEEE